MSANVEPLYCYRIHWSEEDAEFVGLCAELPGLSWLAPTQEEASSGIRRVVAEAVAERHDRRLFVVGSLREVLVGRGLSHAKTQRRQGERDQRTSPFGSLREA